MTKAIIVMILLINLGRFHQRARFHTVFQRAQWKGERVAHISEDQWASCVSNWDKSVTNRSLPACKRLEARAELEPLGAKTPYQIPAQVMDHGVPCAAI